jgi:SAM-dependent methyltransferase
MESNNEMNGFNQDTYPRDYKSFLENSSLAKELIEGSYLSEADYEAWRNKREFIAKAIEKDGSVLDIGCANGFLLRSLQEWTGKDLDPYGIDPLVKNITESRKLFPDIANHFVNAPLAHLPNLSAEFLPEAFDCVYWNVWTQETLKDEKGIEGLKELWRRTKPGGRLILGFYDTPELNQQKVEAIKSNGYQISGTLQNPEGQESLVWIEKYKTPTSENS